MENNLKERNDLIRRGDAIDLCEMAIDDSWEYDYAEDRMFEIPAVDAVEVIHARPVKFYSDPYTERLFTTCSACDGKIGPRDKWCKHCGARMDGEEEHDAVD